jgi:hypothetical protein
MAVWLQFGGYLSRSGTLLEARRSKLKKENKMANNFNMVAFMDSLIEGGFSEKQAKALANAMFQLIDTHLVTKDYLDMRLAQLKSEMIQWMVGLVVVQSGVTAVLFKLLH